MERRVRAYYGRKSLIGVGMNLYILPSGKEALGDAMFDDAEAEREGNRQQLRFWKTFKDACAKRGIEVHTSDFYSPSPNTPQPAAGMKARRILRSLGEAGLKASENSADTSRRSREELHAPQKRHNDDMLLVHVHPEKSFLRQFFSLIKNRGRSGDSFAMKRADFFLENYKYFKRRVLMQAEPPVVSPGVYKNLSKFIKSGLYEKIFLTCRGFGPESGYFNYFKDGAGDIVSPHFSNPKEKFLVLMNANNRPHSLRRELFGERLAAIRYFSGVPGFDLYGPRWNKAPRHPLFWHYGKYAKLCWRGTADGKMPVISQYKFMICYENCVYDGYVSEKIFDCMAAGVIPIYLGAPDINSIVPESCFIDRRKFQNNEELHQFLMSLKEEDLKRYRASILSFLRGRPADGMEKFLDRLFA